LPDGRTINVCPSAGVCKDLCYARNGTYLFPVVKASHQRNLLMTLDDLPGWTASMIAELREKRFRPTGNPRFLDRRDELVSDEWAVEWMDGGGIAVRIHDGGDFYSADYFVAWQEIAAAIPDVLFYAYTKEVKMVEAATHNRPLKNLRIIFSLGGIQDHRINRDDDRHAEVFPDLVSLALAGYTDQEDNDLLCVLLDTPRIGVPANEIPAFKKRMGVATFGSLEHDKNRWSARAA